MTSTLYINTAHVKEMLDRVIDPHVHNREMIVEYFTSVIQSRYGEAATLAKVMLNILPEPTYSVGDTIYIHRDQVYIGSYDFDKTRAAGFILTEDDNYIKAEITDINKFRDSVYDIWVKKVATTDTIEVYSTTVSEDRIYHEKIIPGPGRLNVGDII